MAWWASETHADRRPFLVARGRIKAALLAWFADQGFTEVECAALQVSPGNETHLHAFGTAFTPEDGGAPSPLYLRTSPEFACKMLLAAGETRIFDFARCWRNGEQSALHAPEFTMVEWYRTAAPVEAVMEDTLALCRAALTATGRTALEWRGKLCDPFAPPERLSLIEAFDRIGIELEAVLEDRDRFAAAALDAGVSVTHSDDWSDIFSKMLVARIEPHLGEGRPTILHSYPLEEAALARPLADDPRFAGRFELYACGVELANGFDELTDASEQRSRFEAAMAEKQRRYGIRYPLDEEFLAALPEMPDASGVALGFERLVMLASGARHISDVLWTPVAIG